MSREAIAELDDPTTLRVGINLGNMLLVTDRKPDGTPVGVAPDMAARIAAALGTGVEFKCYPTPGEVGDAIDTWDICLIAIEPKRAEIIDFCEAYVQIEATYLVPAGSPLEKIEDVDKPGIKIAVPARAAYDLYLTRTLQHAELVHGQGLPGTFEMFKQGGQDALAGLTPALLENAKEMPGSRVLPGRYTAIKQSVGTKHGKPALKAVVEKVLAEAVADGTVQSLIDKHGVTGKLAVATDD